MWTTRITLGCLLMLMSGSTEVLSQVKKKPAGAAASSAQVLVGSLTIDQCKAFGGQAMETTRSNCSSGQVCFMENKIVYFYCIAAHVVSEKR
jgi:hypothetical protein